MTDGAGATRWLGGARRRLCGALLSLLATACNPPLPSVPPAPSRPTPPADDGTGVRDFLRVEEQALQWLSAADPRLAARTHVAAADALLAAIGTEAVLAEDGAAEIRGGSLDLFAFRARARALDRAAKAVAGFKETLPDFAGVESPLARPKLERELLQRLVEEEQQRAIDEAHLGDGSGDLVRGILSTWSAQTSPQDGPDRDAWVSKHLLDIRNALESEPARDGPFDLDVALYPLERLLVPIQFPRGSAAIAEVRVAIDQATGAVAVLAGPARIAHMAKAHLGIEVDVSTLPAVFAQTEARLRTLAEKALAAAGSHRADIEARARALLFVEGSCPAVPRSRVRMMGPPPERAAICGAMGAALGDDAASGLVTLHDDVLLALSAVTAAPPPRTGLLSKPPDERVDDIRREARERPVIAVGIALAAGILYGGPDVASPSESWRALGEAPLDVVMRELK